MWITKRTSIPTCRFRSSFRFEAARGLAPASRASPPIFRETPFWDRFFDVVEILPGVENAFAKNYNREALTAG